MLIEEERIKSKKQLKDWIRYETVLRGGTCLLKEFFEIGERAIINKLLKRLRKTEYYFNTGKKLRYFISKLRLSKIMNKYSMHVAMNCCARGLSFVHVGPILMNGNCVVGRDCVFHINTALVASGPYDEAPVLGDGVVLGIGAVVVGGIKVANNVAVGANSVVCKSIDEENVAVAGAPAKIVSKNGALTWNGRKKRSVLFSNSTII